MDNPRIDKDGTKRWYDSNGKLHRDDGPAVVYTNGHQSWYQHGQLHREDGPAIENASGDKSWYQHGLFHRDDGPAIIYASGRKLWYLTGSWVSFDEWLHKVEISDEKKVMMKLKYG
jgi:hypothetical protein